MDKEFWLERWTAGNTGWDQGHVNPLLERFASRLLPVARRVVLVPLCGKAHDMAWLAGQGHRVIGVEISELAAKQFYEREQIEATVSEDSPFRRYSGGGVEILVGDIFDLTPAHVAAVSAVFDRGALVALPAALRARYGELLNRLLPAATNTLMVTMSYDQSQMDGPPFSVSEQELRALFDQRFEVSLLASSDILAQETKFAERGLSALMERAWLLQS